jgi:hypothetical protein
MDGGTKHKEEIKQMLSQLKANFYLIDLLVGYSMPVFVYGLYRVRVVTKVTWQLFWVGAAIGLLWEVPIFVLSAEATPYPIIEWINPLPYHYLIFMLCHTLWDGGLFLAGMLLVCLLSSPPRFERFSFRELFMFLCYGQVSALLVELASTFSDGWVYLHGYWWNPTLFLFNGHPITLLPQLVWFVAPVLFYLCALNANR